MRSRFLLLCSNLLLMMMSLPAMAGSISFTNLRFVADPAGGPGVSARVRYVCADSAWDGQSYTLTRTGTTLTVTIPNSDSVLCFGPPPPPADIDLPLGTLAPGDYQWVLQEAPALPGGNPVTLMSGPFTVLDANAAPYSNLRVTPNPVAVGTQALAQVRFTCMNGAATGVPVVTRAGQVITVRVPVTLELCFGGVPPPPQDINLSIGQHDAGQYTLVMQQELPSTSVVIPALSTTFGIGGSTQSIPVASTAGLFVMILLVLLLGVMWQRRSG